MSAVRTISLLGISVPYRRHPARGDRRRYSCFAALRPLAENLGFAWKPQYMKAQAKYKDEISLIEMEAGDGKYRRMICMPYYCIFDWMLSLPIKQMKSHLQTPMRLYQDFMDDVSRKNSIDLMQLCRLLFLDEFCEDIGPTDTEKQIIPNAGTNLAYRYLITKDRSFTILARYACQSHLIMLEARRDHHGVAGQTHEPDDGTRLRALN